MKKLIVLGILVLSVTALFAAHAVYVEVFNSDLTHPVEGDIYYSAYLLKHPDDILDNNSVGCTYLHDNGLMQAVMQNFAYGDWVPGDVIHFDAEELSSGETGSGDYATTSAGFDYYPMPDDGMYLSGGGVPGPELLFYKIYRDDIEIGETTDAETTTYTDDTAINGATYSYYVTAVYDEGESSPSNTVEITLPTPNEAPIADAGEDQTVYVGTTVTLDGSGSYDSDGTIVSWDWTWDGGSASGETVDVDFDVGTYNVTLTVTDNDGDTDDDEVIITVSPPPSDIILTVETVDANNGSEGVIVPVNVIFPQDYLCSAADISFAGYFGEMIFVEVNTDGTLIGNAGWALQYNETGEFLITASAGAEDISGSGVLFNLVFDIPDDATNGLIPITIESAVFNTGANPVETHDGGVNVIETFEVTATADPEEGGYVEGAGTYEYGATATLTATAYTGYYFVNWTEDDVEVSTEATYSFEVYSDRDLVANFVLETFAVTATANPVEGGSVEGAGTYEYGATATLTATANTGYDFVNWTEDDVEVSTEATYSFEVYSDRDLVANFVLETFEVTATADPEEGGYVEGAGTYEYGATATLTATANTGYDFVNWTEDGAEVSTDLSFDAVITEAHDYVANFELKTFEVTATANPVEGGSVEGAGTYEYGATATLTATVNTGYDFVNWTEDGAEVSTNLSFDVVITEAHDYVANFEYIVVYGDVDQSGEVQSFDAGQILKWIVGYIDLTDQQLLNADVNISGDVTALDATIILQYMVGLVPGLPYTDGMYAASGDIIFNDQTANPGEIVEIPILVENFDNIFSFESTINYDSELLTFQNIVWSNAVDNCMIEENDMGGEIKIAAAGTNVLDCGRSEFAILRFEVGALTQDGTSITLSHRWNEEEFDEYSAGLYPPVGIGPDGNPLYTELIGNYPNPFGNETTIRFSIKEPTYVKLSVYNIMGQLVENIIDEHTAPQIYTKQWDSSEYPNGIYFYKLETDNKSFIKKMILMR